ncbi:hypothetical protein [Roseimicrobium sp. ORNL1]|uniref:hypothetical protein n=1 Tax=Roseimicrobium sp. ORNL1 TaxID=2711231 RepID=UPI0013E115F2|nr:hypothetical protein [Roseimicrobium sp. ORNL1]QIF03596.1 hypothetical protein G5S37_19400 [Roseimicrobium sp. ORNL1]
MTQEPCTRLNVPMLIVVLAVVIITPLGLYILMQRAGEQGNLVECLSNCRQITMALKAYADDHNGEMPDSALDQPRSSNEAFRLLFTEHYLDNEMWFGCPFSPFHPDGQVGSEPQFTKALEAGENHWAMTAGVGKDTPDSVPLVYENPAIASWPPQWNYAARGTATKGRTWSKGIVRSSLDGTAFLQKVDAFWWSSTVGLAKNPTGKDPFERALDPVKFPKGVVLDVLQKAE